MRKNKHDMIIDKLVNRLYHSQIKYDIIEHEREYRLQNNTAGECDIMAYHNGHLLLFEVKTNDKRKNRVKAYHQLDKDVLYYNRLFKPKNIHKFYVYSAGNEYIIERVKLNF